MGGYELVQAFETINVYRSGAGAKLEFNRPERLNAWNVQLTTELGPVLTDVAADPAVRSLLITGAGRAFSSGADIRQPRPQPGGPARNDALREVYHPIMRTVRLMPKPVISAVNGPVAGVAVAFALWADLVVAAESAYFLQPFVNIGIAPDGGSSAIVPARVGFTRAAEMALLGERISARQALEWGLINRVWPDAELASRAEELALKMADGPTQSYAGIKRELNHWYFGEQLDAQLETEAGIQAEMGATADAAEGRAAFAEKRAARFSGR